MIFISYRRDGGSEIPSLIAERLSQKKKYKVFFDINTLKAGRFDHALLQNVKESKHFVLILTPGALDRCIQDKVHNTSEDWVHKEIVAALENGLNIIPVIHHAFEYPLDEDSPEDMRDICRFNGIPWNHYYQGAASNFRVFERKKFLGG